MAGKKTGWIGLRVSPKDKSEVEREAAAHERSVSAYLIDCHRESRQRRRDESDILAALDGKQLKRRKRRQG